jgi:Cu/Ag efflux protein CusF
MFKKSTLLMLLICSVCFGYAMAQDYQPENQPAQEPKHSTELTGQIQNITGVVDKVDLDKKMITVKDSVTNERKEFTFDAATSFSKQNLPASATDLKKGDRVSLAVDSQNMVAAIKVEDSTKPEKEKTQD